MCVRHAKVTTVCGMVTVIEYGVAQGQRNYKLRALLLLSECATILPLRLGIDSYGQSSMISIHNWQAYSGNAPEDIQLRTVVMSLSFFCAATICLLLSD